MNVCRSKNAGHSMCAVASILLMAAASLLTSCSKSKSQVATLEDVIYTVGDSSLTISGVVAQIPPGLNPTDSTALFNAITEDWLYSMLLENEAQLSYSEREQVERQVRQYRQRLLAVRYRESVAAANSAEVVPESTVKAEYEAHKDDYVLQSPMVKGVMVQMPASAADLPRIRQWMADLTMSNVDRLEKAALPSALQYEYFMDEWHDWRDISALIPYRFPAADSYVASNPKLETHSSGSVYLLTITDHLITGSQMPYTVAAPLIRTEIMRRNQDDADRIIMRNLRRKAINNGILKEYKH